MIGLDLGGDSVVGPTVQRALRSAEIEVSPSLKLADNGVAIAYVHAIYSPSPPSKSPLMRPEEASGLVMLLVRTDSLLSLSPRQTNLLDVSLTRQENTLSSDDVPVFQSKAHKTPGWLDTTLPRFERRELVETPYFPYELKVASQLRLSMITRRGMAAAVLFAILPSYLIFLIIVIRYHASTHSKRAIAPSS